MKSRVKIVKELNFKKIYVLPYDSWNECVSYLFYYEIIAKNNQRISSIISMAEVYQEKEQRSK